MSETHDAEKIARSDYDFRMWMVKTVTSLSTKMDILVGPDGTNGWKGEVEKDIETLKGDKAGRTGFNRALAIGSSFASGVLGTVAGYFLHK